MAESHSSYVKTAWICALLTAMTVLGASTKAPAVRSDAEVTRIFREKLAKSKLASEGIQIRVQGGVATITGKTDIVQHKGTATRMAKSSGAREVRNQMTIGEAARRVAVERLTARRRSETAPPASRTPAAPSPTGSPAEQKTQPLTGPAAPPVRHAQVKHD